MSRFYSFLLLLLFAAWPLSAQPFIYWTNLNGNTIGRSGFDGSDVNQNFITGANYPSSVWVDDHHIYWTNLFSNSIGRANLDGSDVNQSFIVTMNEPVGVLVDGTYIYWTSHAANSMGRANLDGTGVDHSFISTGPYPTGLTTDGTYLYWAHWNGKTVGRAHLDGTNVDLAFITTMSESAGIAVDDAYIYWSNGSPSNTIGRANLDGTDVNQSYITGLNNPRHISTDGTFLYWANFLYNTVGRAHRDGTGVNQDYITGMTGVFGVTTSNNGVLPVELTSFTATLDGSSALLRWSTASETNNAGFTIEHRTGAGPFETLGFVAGRGTTLESTRYAHAVPGLAPGTHTFRLRQIDFDGAFAYSPEIELSVEATGVSLALLGGAASGVLRGSLTLEHGEGHLTLYDVLGREAAGVRGVAGAFSLDVSSLPSGVYVLRAEAGSHTITRQVVVAR